MKISAAELRKVRAKLIEQHQDGLEGIGNTLQNDLYEVLVEKFLELLEKERGVIVYNDKNVTLTYAIDKIFDEFNDSKLEKFAKKFANDINEITDLNIKYYKSMSDDLKKFAAIETKVKDLMNKRLGIGANNKLIKKGFLDSFIRDTGLRNSVKNKVLDMITREIAPKDFLRVLKENIKGTDQVDGAIVRKFKDFIFDVYQKQDRATSKEFASVLNLQCFIYTGGIIDTSRKFCEDRNNKVFTLEEAEKWRKDPDLPKTTIERESGVVTDYEPVIDCGRWRCRHHVNYVSRAEAIRLRPDLRDKI